MEVQVWGDIIVSSLQNVANAVAWFLPLIIGSVIVFVVGLVVATALGKTVEQIIKVLKVDSFLSKLAFEQALERAGWKLNSGAFLGGLVRWFIIIAFLLASINILGDRFKPISDFLISVLTYLPNVVVAALILIIGALVADFTEKLVRGSVEAVGYKGSIAGIAVRWGIWVFAISAALLQLQIAKELVAIVLTPVVFALALAFGLAFGLGGKGAATDFLDKMRSELKR